jgi:2-oxoglutarate dehydrogenase E1 component
MHIDDITIKMWLQNRMESERNRLVLSRDEQVRILTALTDAVIFEEFIQRKYLGAKRFSLEGAESLIPLLDLAIERGCEHGFEEIVIGMAHRGRLNVLANIMGKSPRQIFWEFEDSNPELYIGGGDVKYHLGYSSDRVTSGGCTVHLSLCFNPSHLEFVDPVALGRTRAKQDRRDDTARQQVMAILIHGDAAFMGQGVVQESLNLSELDGYTTGGTLHVIVNNQIGFTTSPREGRSSIYASAVAQVVAVAMDFRTTFQRDVVIDMYGYRRYGHNEGDEPAFTHPVMYDRIRKMKSVREGYLERLLKLGEVTREEADEIAARQRAALEEDLTGARAADYAAAPDTLGGVWEDYLGGPEEGVDEVDTSVAINQLSSIMLSLTRTPEGFHVNPKVQRILDGRAGMAQGKRPLDWATAESAALGTLAADGHRIRLSGQDAGRGTFSQRHAILHDAVDGHPYCPLQHVSPDQGPVEILNSPLSEVAVLGFEYGYSLDCPGGLILWEAQFGDFSNVAQPIIDQFIASAEDKWYRLSGMSMLLPHGFEGQGPEHSSARLERFLILAAEDNIQVTNPTTPAQYFHLLRRQALRRWRKPLVVMTPKSLLRSPEATSPLEALSRDRFHRILDDPRQPDAKHVRRVLLCSGKIYYDLDAERQKQEIDDVAILRLEQLYPLPDEALAEALTPFPDSTPVLWVQEEPENNGAWRYLRVRFGERLLDRFPFAGLYREASASPATGSTASHHLEQQEIVSRALAP